MFRNALRQSSRTVATVGRIASVSPTFSRLGQIVALYVANHGDFLSMASIVDNIDLKIDIATVVMYARLTVLSLTKFYLLDRSARLLLVS
jgi:hypothetical protein